MCVLFECDEDKIAYFADQITENTKVYVGKLTPGIFNLLHEGVEHIYTSFPEGKIRRLSIEIGGQDETELLDLLEFNGFKLDDRAKSIMVGWDTFKRSLREPNPKEPDYTKWQLKPKEKVVFFILRGKDLAPPHPEDIPRCNKFGSE